MVVKFLEFEEINEGELNDDLEIINGDLPAIGEDLSETPFIKAPQRKKTFKPPPPKTEEIVEDEEPHIQEVKKIKPKKPLSEKQKAHLEKMRLKKANKKKDQIEKKLEKSDIVTKVEKKMEIPKDFSEEEILDMDKKEFDKWIKYMDRFEKMVEAMEKQKQRELEKIRKEEEIIERRIRRKIAEEDKQRNNKKHNIPDYSNIKKAPVLENKKNDYGEYSSMFGY
mgnify:FL=1|tara:strand:- start:5262 stop:5933 length:672 start_codon:yes stop_codon:yes gene_type:complete